MQEEISRIKTQRNIEKITTFEQRVESAYHKLSKGMTDALQILMGIKIDIHYGGISGGRCCSFELEDRIDTMKEWINKLEEDLQKPIHLREQAGKEKRRRIHDSFNPDKRQKLLLSPVEHNNNSNTTNTTNTTLQEDLLKRISIVEKKLNDSEERNRILQNALEFEKEKTNNTIIH